jgi:primary-amine oxidase
VSAATNDTMPSMPWLTGVTQYLDWDHLSNSGAPVKMRGVVCIHEQDDGIGWKHTNFRTNKPSVTRSRVLIIQTIVSVACWRWSSADRDRSLWPTTSQSALCALNDVADGVRYIFAWKLDQAAGLHLETRATGEPCWLLKPVR